jgi:hypothetical protein
LIHILHPNLSYAFLKVPSHISEYMVLSSPLGELKGCYNWDIVDRPHRSYNHPYRISTDMKDIHI